MKENNVYIFDLVTNFFIPFGILTHGNIINSTSDGMRVSQKEMLGNLKKENLTLKNVAFALSLKMSALFVVTKL